jgi:hypothetical protein
VPDGSSVKYTYPSDHYAVTALVQLRGKDGDADGVVDQHDNCPGAANPLAQDTDADGAGDPCDNCILSANASLVPDSGGHSQLDADLDGYGNACDGDLDQDQVVGSPDWAIVVACLGAMSGTPGGPPDDPLCSESDLTGDAVVGAPDFQLFTSMLGSPPGPSGPANPTDFDTDGIPNDGDNCTLRVNAPLTPDADLDGYGNACDGDLDQDQVVGGTDWAILVACLGAMSGTPGGPPDDPLCSESDLTEDAVVGAPDFQLFTSMFGSPPGPSGLECAGTSPCPGP